MYYLSEKIPEYNLLLPSNLFNEKTKTNETKEEDDYFSDIKLTNCSKVLIKYIINYLGDI